MKILPILISFAFFIAVASGLTANQALAAAPTFGPNFLVTDSSNFNVDSNDGPPILDIDVAGGIYVAWIEHRNNLPEEVFFAKLDPSGVGFTDNKPITGINDQKSFAQIEEDEGVIYIAWHETRVTDGVVKNGIFFTKSVDGGQTFSEEIFIDAAVGLPFSMVAHDEQIYIVYAIYKEVCCFNQWSEIWIAASTDQGNTFTKSHVAGSRGAGDSDQRPAVDFRQNQVFVSWYDYSGIKFARSSDGGVTFEAPHYIFKPANAAIHRLGNTFGRMSLKTSTSGTIFMAFDFFYAFGNPEIFDFEVYSMKSTDSGVTFTPAKRLSDNPISSETRQQTPSLTLLPDGSPVVAWHDTRDGPDQPKIFLTFSQDQGDSFSPNIRINNTAANHVFSAPTIVADHEGKIHFVRWDAALDPAGIYYTKIDLGLQFEIPPTPFLDLPWDYQSKGLSFTEAVLAINSFFDHEYPLLSSGVSEPAGTTNSVVIYKGPPRITEDYSSHDGYDYGNPAKVNIGDPVLAASAGIASFFTCGSCGNAILIDHGNGYQTRYYHLQSEGLIVNQAGQSVSVTKGQSIGKVGATGRVIPPGDLGAHIHFMVVQDKNNDGNFDDNIPDGVTDPFGWQSTETDPWPAFEFNQGGQQRTGNKSHYLWTKIIADLLNPLDSNGGSYELERYKMEFQQGSTDENLTLEMEYAPQVKQSNTIESIGATIIVTAKNALGEFVEEFTKPYTISIDFSVFDLSTFDLATISIHSSDDGVNWQKENTTVDLENKEATAQISHLSHFALMAERLDTVAPTTATILSGDQGEPNWFRSNVQVSLNAQDNQGGLGVDYTLYKLDDGDWQEYSQPLTISQVGNHTVAFYSVDKDENIEEIKSVSFTIDKTPPEAKIQFNPTTFKTEITGLDNNGEVSISREDNLIIKKTIITDKAGNNLKIAGINSKIGNSTTITIKSLSYNNGPPVNFDINKFYTLYSQGFNKLISLSQSWLDTDDVFLEIFYQTLTGKSTIYTKKPNQDTQKETRNGLVLLQLKTKQGNLEYSY